jgi:hypothetical protein
MDNRFSAGLRAGRKEAVHGNGVRTQQNDEDLFEGKLAKGDYGAPKAMVGLAH